ncbi:MAG TPA: hypothetical protein VIM65_03325 [Cyclobacteriaceae bacterium]
MIEVFKTDITDSIQAKVLADHIHNLFKEYTVNFDLDDCDRIMRVVSTSPVVQVDILIDLLKGFGYHAEVLQDDHDDTFSLHTPPLFLLN